MSQDRIIIGKRESNNSAWEAYTNVHKRKRVYGARKLARNDLRARRRS